jgi:hypothetical protein
MPDPGEALELVMDDVERGMRAWLSVDDDLEASGFRLLEPFDREPDQFRNDETGTAVIVWAYRGRHAGDIMGIVPTGRIIDVHGVTIVRDTEEGPRYSRFVDWITALGEMGVGLFSRPIIDEGPPEDLI